MSSDEEARTEARSRWRSLHPDSPLERECIQQEAFVAGAEWERNHPITDAEVEAAARAIYQTERSQTSLGKFWPDWNRLLDAGTDDADLALSNYRDRARAALTAARGTEQ